MITLYHSPRTRSVRVLWLLEELGLPYELKAVPFTQDSLKSPEYLKLNPFGKVPALTDGDLTMFESGAIVEYLLERYGQGRLAPPVGSVERGAFLQWVHFAEATLMPPLGAMAQHMIFLPEADRIPAVVVDSQTKVMAMLTAVAAALGDKTYILGTTFSAADIMLGYSLLLTKWFGMLGDFPTLQAYLARLEERPALKKTLAA
jgi:glutathione S-transferase